jgi:4'-phosphopantetheinyl transferase
VPKDDNWLTLGERARLAKLRFPKRRAEWRLGRWTAKCLIAAYFENEARSSSFRSRMPEGITTNAIEIRAAADGAPEAFMNDKLIPMTLSISHRDEIGFCVINSCNLAIGCDIEKVKSRSDNFVEDYFTAKEKELIQRAPEKDHHRLATLIWSAKESALKALRQGLRLDTRSVVVDVTQAASLQPTWTPYQECHSGRIFFEFKAIAGNEKDSSGMTRRLTDAGNEQDSSGMTKPFAEPFQPTEWNTLTVRYTETARTFHGWWRQKHEYIQTIVTDLRGGNAKNPTQHAGAGFCFA